MIQDINPSIFNNSFKNCRPADGDLILQFGKNGKILVKPENGGLTFPVAGPGRSGQTSPLTPLQCSEGNISVAETARNGQVIYLFSLDERRYFLFVGVCETEHDGYTFQSLRELRGNCCNADLLVAFTAYHLWRWYTDNRFCGRCAKPLSFSESERALVCECGNTVYPRINPAVIVAVTNGDSLLVTRYRNGYSHNALIAGFTEIGETFEQTVSREVMEEAGIKVKNIRYYKSQPWGIAQDILVGYFCDVDGDDTIRMDENELKSAQWLKRGEIELQPGNISLTNEMMKLFKDSEKV